MNIQKKRQIAQIAIIVCMLLIVLFIPFSKMLNIPDSLQWVPLILVWLPLYLVFRYNKKMKEEKAIDTGSKNLDINAVNATRRKVRKNFLLIWALVVLFSLASPLWLPFTMGENRGILFNFMIGLFTAILISVVFGIRLRKMNKQSEEMQKDRTSSLQN